MDKNITIPYSLLSHTIMLLECCDITVFDPIARQDYDDVLFALTKKKQSVELRDAYAKIIYAENDDVKHMARMNYLQQKRLMEEPF